MMEVRLEISPDNLRKEKDGLAFGRPFTLYMLQVGEMADLQRREQRKQSAIVRDAIDLYYQTANNKKLRELTGLPAADLVARALELLHERVRVVQAEAG